MQPLLLSHFSIVTGMGRGLNATLDALQAGRSGLRPQHFAGGIETWTGTIDSLDAIAMPEGLEAFECRNNRLAMLALKQDHFTDAVTAAALKYGAHRIGLFLGTSTSGIEQTELAYLKRDSNTGRLPSDFHYAETHNTFSVARFVASLLNLTGPAIVVSAACATTAKAFGNAARMIAAGFCDAAIVGGADTLCSTTIYGFHSLGLVSSGPCHPFDTARDGISIGEGSGFALVEKLPDHMPADGILLRGFGESSDAYHMSSPHPEGAGARLAMERALLSAKLTPGDIDYINVHGTATPVGDAAEDHAVVELFGRQTPCSSTKGYTGHTLGAAGIVETAISALAIRNNFIPGSAHTREIDPALHSRFLTKSNSAPVNRVMSNSFGFGGSNCSLILERAG